MAFNREEFVSKRDDALKEALTYKVRAEFHDAELKVAISDADKAVHQAGKNMAEAAFRNCTNNVATYDALIFAIDQDPQISREDAHEIVKAKAPELAAKMIAQIEELERGDEELER